MFLGKIFKFIASIFLVLLCFSGIIFCEEKYTPELSSSQEKEVLDYVRKNTHPEYYKRLMLEKAERPESYRRSLLRNKEILDSQERLKKENPELYNKLQAQKDSDVAIFDNVPELSSFQEKEVLDYVRKNTHPEYYKRLMLEKAERPESYRRSLLRNKEILDSQERLKKENPELYNKLQAQKDSDV